MMFITNVHAYALFHDNFVIEGKSNAVQHTMPPYNTILSIEDSMLSTQKAVISPFIKRT